jgi:phosphoglucomutase
LKYVLTDGSWIAVRPSGTEPKIKFYMATQAVTAEESAKKLQAIEDSVNAIVKE